MYRSQLVYKICSVCLGLLARLRLVRNREALEQKLRKTIDQYAMCISVIAGRKWLPVKVLLLNISQRFAQILITCFVCMSAPTGLSFPQRHGKAGVLYDRLQCGPAARRSGSL